MADIHSFFSVLILMVRTYICMNIIQLKKQS